MPWASNRPMSVLPHAVCCHLEGELAARRRGGRRISGGVATWKPQFGQLASSPNELLQRGHTLGMAKQFLIAVCGVDLSRPRRLTPCPPGAGSVSSSNYSIFSGGIQRLPDTFEPLPFRRA